MEFSLILGGIFVVAALLLFKGVYVVQQSECIIIERLGKYNRTLNSGLNITFPILDSPRSMMWFVVNKLNFTHRIDLRETVLDVPQQAVITKDNVSIEIDTLLYIQIIDPIKAVYEISNLSQAVGQLAQTSLRNVIGEMDLDETLASRDTINNKLKSILDDASEKWGVKLNRVELKDISPPQDIQLAMEKQMQAERERRAKVLDAQGDKEARIARSEGLKLEQVNLAEGKREAAIREAQGEAEAVKLVADATTKAISDINMSTDNPDLTVKYLITNQYIEEFGKFSQKEGDKVFIPYEASTALGSLGSIAQLVQMKESSNESS